LRTYAWPGNVRELENLIKRFVILQDEQIVHAELTRVRPGAEALPEAMASPASMTVSAPAIAQPAVVPVATPPRPTERAKSDESLPDLARRAALVAERDAIRRTLDHFRWNRRKAAERLGVSYKTLLNKMKECGISAPPDAPLEG
jgi:two-component system response regulator AtoC